MDEYELNGVRLALPEGMGGKRIGAKLQSGGYEGSEAQAVLRRIKPGFKVLELGGGMGYISALCARLSGAENVVTVEANPLMLPVIRANLDRNGYQAATLIHGAVTGDAVEGKSLLFQQGGQFWGSAIAGADADPDKVVEVPLLRISDLLAEHKPQAVIMDIEGAEQHLFDKKWPHHVRLVMMELHLKRYPDTVIKRIVDCMSDSGLTYDPQTSRGTVLGFRRVRQK